MATLLDSIEAEVMPDHCLITGRREVRALARTPAWFDDIPTGIEHFRLRIWPT